MVSQDSVIYFDSKISGYPLLGHKQSFRKIIISIDVFRLRKNKMKNKTPK